VLVEDKLFATLDPTTRRIILPDKSAVLITDTVGFIQNLPLTIVTAFRATLEELTEATVLLHVVDLTSHNAAGQCQTVENILADLNLRDKPRLTVLNKMDLLIPSEAALDEAAVIDFISSRCTTPDENTVLISSTKGWGLSKLLELVNQILNKTTQPVHQKVSRALGNPTMEI
jgi:GTP-binding protein HflX